MRQRRTLDRRRLALDLMTVEYERLGTIAGDPIAPTTTDAIHEKFVRHTSPCIGAQKAANLGDRVLDTLLHTPAGDAISGG